MNALRVRLVLGLLWLLAAGGAVPAVALAQEGAPLGSASRVRLWSVQRGLDAAEARVLERWGRDTLVLRLSSSEAAADASSQTLIVALAELERLQAFGKPGQGRRVWAYAAIGALTGVLVAATFRRTEFWRQAQVAGGVLIAALFVAIGTAQEPGDQWYEVALPRRP